MNIREATESYEAWATARTELVAADLALKHEQMSLAPFTFLRATFYRWAQLWPERCPELADAPEVRAVGDLHVENFGTWRDREGRLVWGINDFDEAYTLPYTNDLVRLAASALLAAEAGHLSVRPGEVCAAILKGYAEWIAAGGRPFVLGDKNRRLREAVSGKGRDPVRFWRKLEALPAAGGEEAEGAEGALRSSVPGTDLPFKVVRRVAGVGSLGRRRLVALAQWRGGMVAREAKALLPSAAAWAADGGNESPAYQEVMGHSVRSQDPSVKVVDSWLVRRLAPDCVKIELGDLARGRDELRLLRAMGGETANIHLGGKSAGEAIREDLGGRESGWLRTAASAMVRATVADRHEWVGGAARPKRK